MDVKKKKPADQVKQACSNTLYPGMPELQLNSNPLSFFEFWPSWLIYTPVVFQWLMLSAKYRSLSLPLIANPAIPLSGMVGESKAAIFAKATGEAKTRIAPWVLLSVQRDIGITLFKARQLIQEAAINYPLVAKPDIGCRGAGVRVINDRCELKRYIQNYPEKSGIILQQLIAYQPEAGLFYIRHPGNTQGEIISITLKYAPYVIGNGIDTLEQLIKKDARAGRLSHLYTTRHRQSLDKILPKGKPFRLLFEGSHSCGSIFKDGRQYITPELTHALDNVCDGMPGYCYGRIDVRFKNIESLMAGKHFIIQEINGASSEAAHIWDGKSTLKELYRVLFYQYSTLFKLGAANRQRGFKTPGLIKLFKAWRREKKLVGFYPKAE